MTEAIDEYLMKRLTQYHDFKFVNICNNDVDMSAYKEIDSEKENKEHEKLIEFLQKTLDKKVSKIKISNRLVDVPCMITTDNFGWSANMERIMNSQVLGDNQMKQFMISSKTLEINIEHPIIKNIENSIGDETRENGIKDIIQLMFDGALLSSGFSIEKPQEFVNKLNRMIEFGLSIDEENLNRIWTRFYKVDESRNRSKGGTGIGLALVKAIMTKYKSQYGVTNKKDGVEFYFEIAEAK